MKENNKDYLVYLINTENKKAINIYHLKRLSDADFVRLAEREGMVLSISEYTDKMNEDNYVFTENLIRIVKKQSIPNYLTTNYAETFFDLLHNHIEDFENSELGKSYLEYIENSTDIEILYDYDLLGELKKEEVFQSQKEYLPNGIYYSHYILYKNFVQLHYKELGDYDCPEKPYINLPLKDSTYPIKNIKGVVKEKS